MRNLKTLLSIVLVSVLLFNCTEQTKTTIESENLSERLDEVKSELRVELKSKDNPALDILNEYAKSSNIDKTILIKEMKLSYAKIKERSKLVASGQLTNDEYFNDVNASLNENTGFKTELGKLISNYYRQKHDNQDFVETPAFEKYKEAKELNSQLKKYENE